MGLRTSNAGTDFEKAPEGMRVGRCYKIIDCGSHLNPIYGSKKRLVWIHWELPTTLMKEGDNSGKPFSIGKRYGLSHNEMSTLRADLESWYGKQFDTKALDKAGGFDLEKILGKAGLLNIVHSDDGKYANIKSVNPLPDGMTCPDQVNTSFMFSLDDFDKEKFEKLSTKMQEFIRESDEYKAMMNGEPRTDKGSVADMDDDIPF
jgi:hypothetical protein